MSCDSNLNDNKPLCIWEYKDVYIFPQIVSNEKKFVTIIYIASYFEIKKESHLKVKITNCRQY